ncbi:MAG: aldolase/citrate lyase family protein [Dehalococcoidales bacterium]
MKNPLKEKLKKGEAVIGTFIMIGHSDVTEWLSRVGFDWLLLDTEHTTTGYETLQRMMQAMNGSDCVPIVRPQWNDPVVIKRVLDIGAYGVLIPWVNSREDAENAVRYCKYPPLGIRGWGPRRAGMFDPDYFKTANDEVLVTVQIETQEALDNLDEILSVPGIDACYIGPWDLSVSLGIGVPPDWDSPKYKAAFDKVLEAAARHNKPAGMFAISDNIEWAVKKGFVYNTVDADDFLLMRGAREVVAKARNAAKK